MQKDTIKQTYDKATNGLEGFTEDLNGMEAFYWCNVVKYVLRFQNKNMLEDLEKAQYYISRLIVSRGKKEW